MNHKTPTENNQHDNKWTSFTYCTPTIRITFRNTNPILQKPKQKRVHTTQGLEQSGIYGLTCKTCLKTYVGQTCRKLATRYHEHTRYIRNNDPQSTYAVHILQNIHEYGTINDTLKLLQPVQNTKLLIPYEQMYIQLYHQQGNLIQEQQRGELNPLLQLAHYTCSETQT
jgi:hypothetical protein